MRTVQVPSAGAAILLVSEGDGQTLIVNDDPNFTLWLGDDSGANSSNSDSVIPVSPNGYLGVNGLGDVYGIADPGTTSIQVFVIDGGISFFLPLSQLIIASSDAAILIYSPIQGFGNLIGSWAAQAFTDQYGNLIPQGINVNGGILNGVTLNNSTYVGGLILNTLIQAPLITQANLQQGTAYETVITFDTGGGAVLGYASTTTTITHTANGTYNDVIPSTVTSGYLEATAAGAGGDGGKTSIGGNGGGGGGYARESAYPLIGGQTLTSIVGNGGTGGTTGNNSHGNNGGDTLIDPGGDAGGVHAFGGQGGGLGGSGTYNTVNHTAGSGGAASSNTGGGSGGNSANASNTNGTGNNGSSSTSTVGAAAPTGQAGSGTGGAGGNQSNNGHAGQAPGGGGGGAGAAVGGSSSIQKNYSPTWIGSYYGPDGGTPNGLRTTGNPWYQGGETSGGGSFNGNQRTILRFNAAQIASDFAGATVSNAILTITNTHSWFSGGASVEFDYSNNKIGATRPSSYPTGISIAHIATGSIAENATASFGLGSTVAGGFAGNSIDSLVIGANIASQNPYNLSYYSSYSSSVTLQVTGTLSSGGGTQQGGPGADGQVKITYVSGQALTMALAAIGGSDANSNLYGAGFTGLVQAFQPGAVPSAVETWHNMTLINGWTVGSGGAAQYKANADNTVSIRLANVVPGTTTNGTVLWNIPSGYYNPAWPLTQNFLIGVTVSSGSPTGSPFVAARAAGTLTVQSLPANLTNIFVNAVRYPLD